MRCRWHNGFNPTCNECQTMQTQGLRFDDGKARVDLLPPDALLELGKVYAFGAKKYSDRNWEKGMKWSKVLGPLMRHLFKWMMGNDRDAESGELHLNHVAWNALALLTYALRGIGENDVQPKVRPEVPE